MGFFDGQTTNKVPTKTPQSISTGGFFSSYNVPITPPVSAPSEVSTTIGQKVLNAGTAVNSFFGGKQLADYLGGKIASAQATPDVKHYVDQSTTGKQALASAGEVALNIAGLATGLGEAKAITAIPKAVNYGKLALEGAGFMGGVSALDSVAQGNDVFSKETGKALVKGATIGAIAGPALSIAGEGLVNAFGKKLTDAERLALAEKKANFGAIPDAGTPFDNVPKPSTNIIDNTFNPNIQTGIPKVNIPNSAVSLTPKVLPKNALENRALGFTDKNEFISNEINFLNRTKQKVSVNTQKLASNAFDKMHPAPVPMETPIIPKTINEMTPAEKVRAYQGETIPKEQPIVPSETQVPPTPEQQDISNKTVEMLDNLQQGNDKIIKVDKITLAEEERKATEVVNNLGIERARKIAMGLENAPEGVRADAVHAVLSNIAAKEGNGALLSELAGSDVSKISAQNIGLGRIKDPTNPYYAIKDILVSLDKKKSMFTTMNETKVKTEFFNNLKDLVEKSGLSNQDIVLAAKKLICK